MVVTAERRKKEVAVDEEATAVTRRKRNKGCTLVEDGVTKRQNDCSSLALTKVSR